MREMLLLLSLVTPVGAGAVEPRMPAPPFDSPSLTTDRTVRLAEYRGKVVYLDFWASWCGPCRLSLPALEIMRDDFADRGFEVVAVNVDEDPRDGRRFLERFPVSYPVVADPEGILPARYDVKAMPSSYLIDRNGIVRYVHRGFRPHDVPDLRRRVDALLKEASP